MAGREFFYPFFQTVFNSYINNVANGGLKQLHEMKENGILTEEEFTEKKKEFLERL